MSRPPDERRGDAERLAHHVLNGWGQPEVTGDPAAALGSQEWLALPARSPRVLLPRGRPRIAARSLVAHDGLRRPGDRVRRRALALLVGSGLPDLAWRSARMGYAAGDPDPLVDVLREQWDERVAALSLTVRPATPNHKPTFVAVDDRGHPLGYGKLAPNPAVAERLQREGDGLRWIERAAVPGLRSPRVLADLAWRGCRVLVVSPLPRRSRRYPVDDRAPAHLLEVARTRGRATSPERVGVRLLERVAATGDPALQDAAAGFLDELVRRHAGVRLDAGRLHGDWVPWNLAVHGRDVWAWDWEHSEAESAAALDVVHWHLLVHRDRRREPLAVAVPAAEAAALADLRDHGISGPAATALLGLGRLRLAARSAELHAGSGLWVADEREVLGTLLTSQPGGAGTTAARASS